mgnify:CR=1 FL=1
MYNFLYYILIFTLLSRQFCLQQSRKQSHKQLSQSQVCTASCTIFFCNFAALFHCLMQVISNIQNSITVCHKASIFKVMIQTPIVQIDCSTSRHTVIRNAHLGMTEARCPFINPNPILDQFMIKGSGNIINQLLIRNSRGDDPYINTTLRSKCQACAISSVMIRYGVINQQYFSALSAILM